MACRLCKSNFREFFKFKNIPLSGVFLSDYDNQDKGDLTLVKCTNCGLVQLKEQYDLKKLYGNTYGYRSGLNSSMVNHLKNNIAKAESCVSLKSSDLVIDIASNDATSLKMYQNKSIIRHGIDPLASKFKKYYEDGITYTCDFFNKQTSIKIKELFDKKAKIITSFSVFYDLPNPIDFAESIDNLLDEDGIWMSEQSYLPYMLKTNSFDTICQEHLEYYSLTDIKNIINSTNLELFDVDFNETNGGSFIFYICKKTNKKIKRNKKLLDKIQIEEKETCSNESLEKFTRNCDSLKIEIQTWIKEVKKKGKNIGGLGASTKGNIALSYFEIDNTMVDAIGDINEEKHGLLTPSGKIPIISEEEVISRNYDFYIVLPWHFKKSFLNNKNLKGKNLVFFHPKHEVIYIQ